MKRRQFLQGLAGCLAAGVAPMAFGIGPAGLSVPKRVAPTVTLYPYQEHFFNAQGERFLVVGVTHNLARGSMSFAVSSLLDPFPARELELTGTANGIQVGDVVSIEGLPAGWPPKVERVDPLLPMHWQAEAWK